MNNFSSVAELHSFAEGLDSVLGKVRELSKNEWAAPVIGAVGGAGLGAGSGILLGDKKKSKIRRALEGAGIGAGLGGLGGLAYKLNAEKKALEEEVSPYRADRDFNAKEAAKLAAVREELNADGQAFLDKQIGWAKRFGLSDDQIKDHLGKGTLGDALDAASEKVSRLAKTANKPGALLLAAAPVSIEAQKQWAGADKVTKGMDDYSKVQSALIALNKALGKEAADSITIVDSGL